MTSNKSNMSSLGDKVAMLQKLRKSSSGGFFAHNDEKENQSSDSSNDIRRMLNSDQIHLRLKSTVILLSESLEEQARLRALLEYTADPSSLLISNGFSKEHEKELKYRAAVLGNEKLLAEYEEEKQKRIQLEKSVDITNQILLEVQTECDSLKEELLTYKRGTNIGRVDGLSRSTGSISRALPPLATRASRSDHLSNRFGGASGHRTSAGSRYAASDEGGGEDEEDSEEGNSPLPPLPIEEEEEEDPLFGGAEVKTLLSTAVAEAKRNNNLAGGSNVPRLPLGSTASGMPPRPAPSVASRGTYASTDATNGKVSDKLQTSSLAFGPAAPTVLTPSTPPPAAAPLHRSVLLDVDLGQGQKDSILIQQDSDPMVLSYDFIEKHSLKPDYFEPLLEYIRATQETLESHLVGALPALEGAVASDPSIVSSPTLNLRGAKSNREPGVGDGGMSSNKTSSPDKPSSPSHTMTTVRGAAESVGSPQKAAFASSSEAPSSQSVSPSKQLEQLSIIPSKANGLMEPASRAHWSSHGKIPVVPHQIGLTLGSVCSPSSSSVFSPSRDPLDSILEEEEDDSSAIDFSKSIKSAIRTYQSISRELKAAKKLGKLSGEEAQEVSSDLSESEEEKKSYESFSLSSSSEEYDAADRVEAGKRRGAKHKKRDGPEEDNYDQLAELSKKKNRNNKGGGDSGPVRRSTLSKGPPDETSLMMNRFQGGGSVPAKGSKNRRTSVFGEIVTRSPSHPNRFKLSDDEDEEQEEDKKKKTNDNSNINKKKHPEEQEEEESPPMSPAVSSKKSNSSISNKKKSPGVEEEEMLDLSDTEYKAPKRKTIHKKMDKFQATAPSMMGKTPKRMSKKPPAAYTNRFERLETRPSVLKQLGGTRVPQHSMIVEEENIPIDESNRGRTSSEQSQGGSSGGYTPPTLQRATSSLRFSDEVTGSPAQGGRPAPLMRQQSQATSLRANNIRSSINDYHAALGNTKDSKELREIFNMAVEVFDRASKMNSSGNLMESLALYQNALKLFRLSKFSGIQYIQEEVGYWENKARESSRKVSVTGGKNKKHAAKAPAGGSKTSQTEDILNSILPPREWTDEGQLWVQYVSSTPATRLDVVNLQEQLDHQLQSRQARETGICPVREELYSQCFDELIRQITINCSERGLLLLRVRDEARMTVSAYETLYESSIAYGVRKALIAEQKRIDLDLKLKELALNKRDLLQQVDNLKKAIELAQARAIEKREAEEKVHADDVERIMRTNEQLKTSLETMLSAPKK